MLNILLLILSVLCAICFGWLTYRQYTDCGYWNTSAILNAICSGLWIFNTVLRVLIILD